MNTKTEIGLRLATLRIEAGYKEVKEFAQNYNFSYATYRRWKLGEREPNSDDLQVLAKIHNVSIDYLLGFENKRVHQKQLPIRINVLGRVPAGVPIEAIEDVIDWEELDPREYDTNKEYFGLLVTGESMSPKYLDGDIVIIEQMEDADSGKDVVAYVNGHDATLKRLVKYGNGNVELKPLNPAYQTMTFTQNEIEIKPVKIIGIVKELRRKI